MIPFRLLPHALVLLACHGKIALAAWLLTTHSAYSAALRWEGTDGGRRASVTVQPSRHVGFTLVDAAQSGASVTNFLREDRHLTNQILLNGSGVAAGDVDGDGWCDLYFCGLDGPNVLLRNRGDFAFEDVTTLSGTACAGMDATGAVLADIDGDGDLDLVVNTVGAGTHIFLNDGKGKFSEVNVLNRGRCGSSLALADIDGDGDLDLYVANYRSVTIRDQPNTRFSIRKVNGSQQVVSVDDVPASDPEVANRFNFRLGGKDGRGTFVYDENGEADVLFRNDGGGRFTALSFTDGTFLDEQGRPLTKPPFDWGLSVMFRDVNGDGAPDIYVCNDFKSPDRFWINDGHGHFRALAPLAIRQMPLSSMGVDFADINRDGHDDFLVVDMFSRQHAHRFTQRIDIRPELIPVGEIENRPQYPRNMLFLGRGDGTWAECAQLSGLEASEWSWTPIFLDVDLDGYEDLLVSNGFERDGMNMDVIRRLELAKKERTLSPVEQLRLRRMIPRLDTGNLAFRNLGNLKFADMSRAWGFDLRGVSHGMCLADLDNDGDQDVVINNLNAPASIYRNEASAPRVAVRLKGSAPNTRGIGAKIKVFGGPVPQSQEMISGGRYLSCDDAMRTFAAGSGPMRIEVTWRSGRRSVVEDVKADHIYEIDERNARAASVVSTDKSAAHFVEASGIINHSHHEEPFDDFSLQPTLAHRLSQLGPGVGWFDVDADGWDDLVLGSGKGGAPAVFRNDGHGGFARFNAPLLAQPVTRDQTTVLGWRAPGEGAVLIAGAANYEDGQTNGSVARVYSLKLGVVADSLPGQASSSGPMAMADVDGDGSLDLFIGGRAVHGRHPMAASSLLFHWRNGKFEIDQENCRELDGVGLVSGAVFSDLDGDGDPDLVLACEWGPLKIFRNEKGRLVAWNPAVSGLETQGSKLRTLNDLTGWWNGVTTGDFNGDGLMDIAASNWGRNTRYESIRPEPLRVFHGELSAGGAHHVIEARAEPGSGRLLPLQPFHVMGIAMPEMRERVGSFENYARSTLPEIYGDGWSRLQELRAVWLESTVFLNRGSHFEAVALPVEAQLAPAFGICAGDLDGDGRVDLFLAQNFFATHPEISRYDGGLGLWLRGDGRGGFSAVPAANSGLRIHGEQRGAALCDYDGDGRVDLAVGQNAAQTKLYRNAGAKPGLRVRLLGLEGNSSGVGAVMRLISGGSFGPAHEIHSGSGYWSQDSAVQVMASAETPTGLWVRWPGGRTNTVAVPAGAREILVEADGTVKILR